MSQASHRIRTTWPLYLAIAVAASASIATSPPPTWLQELWLEGPDLVLGPDLPEQTTPLTIRFSPTLDHANILVGGEIEYEGAAEELRIELIEPDKRTLAAQLQLVEGDGRLAFQLRADRAALTCAPAEDGGCVQELAVRFHTDGAGTGAYAVRWGLQLSTGGGGSEPPANLVFEASLVGGRLTDTLSFPFDFVYPSAEAEQGRWRLMATDYGWYYVKPGQGGASRHFVVRGAGPYTSSELIIPFLVSCGSPAGDDESALRVAIIPDDPAAGPGVEHLARVTGSGAFIATLTFPEPLDCTGTDVCERGFTVVLESESDKYLNLDVRPHAVLDGDGDIAPADAFIEIVPDQVVETAASEDE
jgi:hypothetical protein